MGNILLFLHPLNTLESKLWKKNMQLTRKSRNSEIPGREISGRKKNQNPERNEKKIFFQHFLLSYT
jgi:hypothetical protein